MKTTVIQILIGLTCLVSISSIQGQINRESISTKQALDILKDGNLIFVLPSNHTKINNAKTLINNGKISTKSSKRIQKMIAEAEADQASTIKHYTKIGKEIYEYGQILFIMDYDLQKFFENPNSQFFITPTKDPILSPEFKTPYILCYPTRSREQSLEVFAFKGMNNQSIDRPFPQYIRRQNGIDNLRHFFLRTPTKKLEANRVFRSINKKLLRL